MMRKEDGKEGKGSENYMIQILFYIQMPSSLPDSMHFAANDDSINILVDPERLQPAAFWPDREQVAIPVEIRTKDPIELVRQG
jgi:hypothetical protein